MRRRFGRPSLRDQMLASKRALDFMADSAGKPRMEFDIPPPPKPRAAAGSDGRPLENDVKKAVEELLGTHPDVVFAVRQNSGALYDSRDIPMWFYKIVRSKLDVTITDYWGFLRTGPFAIECKRPGWKFKGTPREVKQEKFIRTIKVLGGRGGFATSVEDAQRIIELQYPDVQG